MASNSYHKWVADGEPYVDAEPIKDEAAILRAHGYTVWTKGDDRHMQAEPPEDHTAFSATGWPVKSAYPKGHAFDVADADKPYPLWQVAEQIIRDKDAGVPGTEWIKYLNYTDADGDCWHVSWQPNKSKTVSSDRGHLHVSARSDMDNVSTTYDPIARLKEADMSAKDLLAEDVVPNRPWRNDHPNNAAANGVKPNENVQWTYAVQNTWDLAHDAAVRSQHALEGVERVEAKLDALTEALKNLTLKASDAGAPGQ